MLACRHTLQASQARKSLLQSMFAQFMCGSTAVAPQAWQGAAASSSSSLSLSANRQQGGSQRWSQYLHEMGGDEAWRDPGPCSAWLCLPGQRPRRHLCCTCTCACSLASWQHSLGRMAMRPSNTKREPFQWSSPSSRM